MEDSRNSIMREAKRSKRSKKKEKLQYKKAKMLILDPEEADWKTTTKKEGRRKWIKNQWMEKKRNSSGPEEESRLSEF